MEDVITKIDGPWSFLAFFLLLVYLTVKELVPILKARNGKNGIKSVTNADLKLAILEHCANCSRIGDVDAKIDSLHKEIQDGFRDIKSDVQKIWQHLAASKV